MQNFSGGFNPYQLHHSQSEISTATTTVSESTEPNQIESSVPISTSFDSNTLFTPLRNKDEEEIKYIMASMEQLRLRNIEDFSKVLLNNKQILDMITKGEIKTKESMKVFDNLFQEIENINFDYLFWSAHKGIRIAAIDYKNLELIHYFFIKKGYKLTNKQMHHNFLNEYMTSLKDIRFLEVNKDEMRKYTTMFQMFINQGDADINDSINEMKNTPLHYAIIYNQFQFFLLLLKNPKINVNALNINGDTPMDMALKNIMIKDNVMLNEEVCIILSDKNGIPNTMKNYFDEKFHVEIETISNEEPINKE